MTEEQQKASLIEEKLCERELRKFQAAIEGLLKPINNALNPFNKHISFSSEEAKEARQWLKDYLLESCITAIMTREVNVRYDGFYFKDIPAYLKKKLREKAVQEFMQQVEEAKEKIEQVEESINYQE